MTHEPHARLWPVPGSVPRAPPTASGGSQVFCPLLCGQGQAAPCLAHGPQDRQALHCLPMSSSPLPLGSKHCLLSHGLPQLFSTPSQDLVSQRGATCCVLTWTDGQGSRGPWLHPEPWVNRGQGWDSWQARSRCLGAMTGDALDGTQHSASRGGGGLLRSDRWIPLLSPARGPGCLSWPGGHM